MNNERGLIDGQINRWTDRQTDEWMDRQTNKIDE